MFTYRGIEVTEEIIGSVQEGGGKPERITLYRATVGGQELVRIQATKVTGGSKEEICDKIDEILGPEDTATQS